MNIRGKYCTIITNRVLVDVISEGNNEKKKIQHNVELERV